MTTLIPEETGTAPSHGVGEKPRTQQEGPCKAPRARTSRPPGAKLGKKASPAKKAPKGRTKAKATEPEARDGSKAAKILDLLKRPGRRQLSKELQKAIQVAAFRTRLH